MSPTLHLRDSGSGEPIVILHGMFGSGRNWQSIARALATQRRVLVVDLRNHGESFHAPAMDYPVMAADVAAAMDAAGVARAAILGHSMGGKTAMQFALDHGARVERLIVVDIAPVAYPAHHVAQFERIVARLRALPLASIGSRAEADRALSQTVADAETRGFLLQNLLREGDGWRWRIDLEAIRANLPRLMGFPAAGDATYGGPALFLGGGDSTGILPEHEPAIAARFPAAIVERMNGAGHNPHSQMPEAFLARVQRFLAGN
ncbi:MAG: alpha/beta fold hydrolase [Gammaproteobacteria bacterium]